MCGGSDAPKQTAEEAELGRIAIDQWNDYQVRFKPIEDQYINDVQVTDSDYSHARSAGNTAVMQAFGQAEENLANNIFMNGLDPSSDSFVKTMDGLSLDRGLSAGASANEAELAVDNANIKGLQNVVAMGQGQSAEAQAGLSGIAGDATNDAINRSRESFNNRSAGLQLVGTAAGIGTAHYMNKEK